MTMERAQINIRLEADLLQKVEKKRIELAAKTGTIPSRSEILRMALEAYLDGIEPRRLNATVATRSKG